MARETVTPIKQTQPLTRYYVFFVNGGPYWFTEWRGDARSGLESLREGIDLPGDMRGSYKVKGNADHATLDVGDGYAYALVDAGNADAADLERCEKILALRLGSVSLSQMADVARANAAGLFHAGAGDLGRLPPPPTDRRPS